MPPRNEIAGHPWREVGCLDKARAEGGGRVFAANGVNFAYRFACLRSAEGIWMSVEFRPKSVHFFFE